MFIRIDHNQLVYIGHLVTLLYLVTSISYTPIMNALLLALSFFIIPLIVLYSRITKLKPIARPISASTLVTFLSILLTTIVLLQIRTFCLTDGLIILLIFICLEITKLASPCLNDASHRLSELRRTSCSPASLTPSRSLPFSLIPFLFYLCVIFQSQMLSFFL